MRKVSYTKTPNELTAPVPFAFRNGLFFNFIVRANNYKLQKVCDQWFNTPSSYEVNIKPFAPLVMISFVYYQRSFSVPWHLQWRNITYQEILFNMFVKQKGSACWKPDNYYTFVPYLFLDNPLPVIAGRDVLGMPKVVSRMTLPDFESTSGGQFRSDTLMMPENGGKDAIAGYEPIIQIDCPKEFNMKALVEKASVPDPYGTNSKMVEQSFHSEIRKSMDVTPDISERIMQFYKMYFLSLRQYRRPDDTGRADIKSIDRFFCENISIHNMGNLAGDFKISYPSKSNSYPVERDLGLENKVLFASWLTWSFQMRGKDSIWTAERANPLDLLFK